MKTVFLLTPGGFMRSFTVPTALAAVLVCAGFGFAGSFHMDANPMADRAALPDIGVAPVLAPWDLLFSFDLEAASGANGNAGAEFDGTYFYSSRWASNLIHQYDINGVLVKEFFIPGVTGLRDLAYDGTYFYGGSASSQIRQMDFENETLVATISGGFTCRAIAYNEDDDTFFVSTWGDPVWEVNRTGGIVRTFNMVSISSKYGFAYDNVTDGGPYLWVFDQIDGTLGTIYQWDLAAGAFTGVTHNVAADFPTTSGIAGGLFFTTDYTPGYSTIGGLLQGVPDMMFMYEWQPTIVEDLVIDIEPVNGQIFNPGDLVRYSVTLTNNTAGPIDVVGATYASNVALWELPLWGPLSFTIQGETTIGPITLQNRVPMGAPPLSAFICAEANDVHDCYQVTVE
jgi:hypothetical protein